MANDHRPKYRQEQTELILRRSHDHYFQIQILGYNFCYILFRSGSLQYSIINTVVFCRLHTVLIIYTYLLTSSVDEWEIWRTNKLFEAESYHSFGSTANTWFYTSVISFMCTIYKSYLVISTKYLGNRVGF